MITIFDYLLHICAKSKLKKILGTDEIKKNPKLILKYLHFKEKLTFDNIPESIFKSQHSTTFRQARTPLGYRFDDMKSALQKYIRRGETDKAIFVANELYAFRLLQGGKPFYTNFINRLKVIALEDIGIAYPDVVCVIDSWLDMISENEPDQLINWNYLHEIISTLSNNLHYRFYSHLGAKMRTMTDDDIIPYKVGEDKRYDLQIKNYINTREHRDFDLWIIQIFMCWKHKDVRIYYWIKKFFDTRLKLNVKAYKSNKPRFLAMLIIEELCMSTENFCIESIFKTCFKWLKGMNVFEVFLCAMHPVLSAITSGENVYIQGKLTDGDFAMKRTKSLIKRNLTYKRIDLEDYVIDKHTRAGRMFGKSTADFAVEGSLVAYEHGALKARFDNEMHTNYIKARVAEKPRTESNVFTLKSRAQLICGNARTDVYYALLKSNNSNIVVKGPYGSFETVNKIYQLCKIMNWFSEINVPNINVKLLSLDMFDDNPIGIRKKLIENDIDMGYFLIFEDIFQMKEYPTIEKNSKLWPKTNVVDYDSVFAGKNIGFGTPSLMTDKAKVSLIHQLCFRYVFEMGDFASRNFCYKDDLAYNLDIEGIFVGNKINWKNEERTLLLTIFKENKDDIIKVWKDWKNTLKDGRLSVILNLSKLQIKKIRDNLKFMVKSFHMWIIS
jgi:hypothetical protein